MLGDMAGEEQQVLAVRSLSATLFVVCNLFSDDNFFYFLVWREAQVDQITMLCLSLSLVAAHAAVTESN